MPTELFFVYTSISLLQMTSMNVRVPLAVTMAIVSMESTRSCAHATLVTKATSAKVWLMNDLLFL